MFNRTRSTHPPFASDGEWFTFMVDELARLYMLRPKPGRAELPELVALKNNEHFEFALADEYLAAINPYRDRHFDDNRLIVDERDGIYVLTPQTVARHHIPDLDRRTQTIKVNAEGVNLINAYDETMVTMESGAIGPGSGMSSAWNRFEAARHIVADFTDGEIDIPDGLFGKVSEIIINRTSTGWRIMVIGIPQDDAR